MQKRDNTIVRNIYLIKTNKNNTYVNKKFLSQFINEYRKTQFYCRFFISLNKTGI